ncbi:hypothetical protein HK405_011981, partial [Cladochytrium tenue]
MSQPTDDPRWTCKGSARCHVHADLNHFISYSHRDFIRYHPLELRGLEIAKALVAHYSSAAYANDSELLPPALHMSTALKMAKKMSRLG